MSRKIERSALVNFSSQAMYDLVNDIEAYPRYMPGCAHAEILTKGENWLEAKLNLQKGGFSQSFITRNTMTPYSRIEMALVEGPFKHLEGVWLFEALSENACKVVFKLSYEFSNPILAFGASKILDKVAAEQVDAVCARAKKIYT